MKASYYLDPYGDDWERSSMSTVQVINTIRSSVPGSRMTEADWWPDDLFVPYRIPKDSRIAQLEAALPQLDAITGL